MGNRNSCFFLRNDCQLYSVRFNLYAISGCRTSDFSREYANYPYGANENVLHLE